MSLYTVIDPARTLSASTTRTLLRVTTPASQRLRVVEVAVSIQGTGASDLPVQVQLVRAASTDGTLTAFTPLLEEDGYPTSLCTAGVHATAEPTGWVVWRSWMVHPAGGLLAMLWPLGREPEIAVSARVGLRVITGALTGTPTISASLTYEEV